MRPSNMSLIHHLQVTHGINELESITFAAKYTCVTYHRNLNVPIHNVLALPNLKLSYG